MAAVEAQDCIPSRYICMQLAMLTTILAFVDGLFACERVMALAEHRQILNMPSTWEQIVQWLDGPRSKEPHGRSSKLETPSDWVMV